MRLFHHPFALIGRDRRADVPLEHKLVSRRHVYLQVVEGQTFWVDLESRSGTWDGGELRKSGWLEADTVIRIGPFELQRLLRGDPTRADPAPPPRPRVSPLSARSHGHLPLPEVALEFLNGPARSACWPMNRVLSLLGSAGGCKFRLADPSVASFHCSLLRTPLGLWVVDLLGPDGIDVNDAPVRSAWLADGDVLRVGRYRIRIRSRFADRDHDPDSAAGRRAVVPVPRPGGEECPGPLPSHGDPPALPPMAWREPTAAGALAPLEPAAQASRIEWMPLASHDPIRLEKAELTETLLVPLVHQFGMMQQQMLDQFQQAMAMLVQMFGTLHREQMDLIREELDRLRDLTKEFHALKLKLAAHSPARAPQTSAGSWGAPADPEERGAVPRIKGREPQPEAAVSPPAAQPGPAPAPAAPSSSPANRSEGPCSSQVPLGPAGPDRPGTGPGPAPARPGGPNPESDRDLVLWLHQRMMALQQEGETRWRKILKLLPGLA